MINQNNALKKLYSTDWDDLIINSKDIPAAHPLLLKLRDEYWNADIKIMIYGQETYGWHGNLEDNKGIDFLMNDYEAYFYDNQEYFNKTQDYDGDDYSRAIGKHKKQGRLKKKGKRSFWNKKNFKYFQNELTKHFKNQEVGFAWNNLSKIGNSNKYRKGKGKAIKSVRSLEYNFFDVFRKEFEILNPDIVIFTTGSRDWIIKKHFGDNTQFISKLYAENGKALEESKNLIAEVKLADFPDICAIRVGHPSRRTLDNSIILEIIKDMWHNKKI